MVAKEHNLPEGWAVTTLGEVIDSAIEQGLPDGGEFLYVDIGSIDTPTKKIVAPKLLSTSKTPSRARQHLMPNDVLISMTRPNLNAVALVPEKFTDTIGSTGFHVLRAIHVNPKFLFYLVQTDRFINSVSEFVQGALYPAVRPKDINGFHFYLSPLDEQHRIVAAIEKEFSRLNEGIDALTRADDDLLLYRASVLRAACEGRLVPPTASLARAKKFNYESGADLLRKILKQRRLKWERDQLVKMKTKGKGPNDNKWKEKYLEPEEPRPGYYRPELPEGWTWAGFEQLAGFAKNAIKVGPFGSKLKKAFYTSAGYKIYGQEQVIKGDPFYGDYYIDRKLYQELISCAVKPGDLLISLVGTAGKVLILPKDIEPGIINPRLLKLTLNPKIINVHYVRFFLESPLLKDHLRLVSHGGTMDILNLAILKDISVPLPPLEEQKRIVAQVEKRLRVIEEIHATVSLNIKRAKELRRSILKRAFIGRLVAQNPDDEPADGLLERIAIERQRKAQESMKEKKPKKHGKSSETTRPPFNEIPKDILKGLTRPGETATIETVFQNGDFNYAPNGEGEFADVDAFFDELAHLLTKTEVMVLRHPEEIILKRREATRRGVRQQR